MAELDGYQRVIDGARQIVNNWKPTIKINPDWEMVKLGEVCDVRDGTHDSPKYKNTGIPLITSKNLKGNNIDFHNVNYISEEDHVKISKRSAVDDGDVLFAMIGTIGNPVVVKKDREFSIKNVALFKFENNNRLSNVYLRTLLNSKFASDNLLIKSRGGTQKFVSLTDLRNFIIPLPTIEKQTEIVADIEAEQQAVESAKKLIEIHEQKIKNKIAEVWGE
ncbi:MAG: restriction endonuclease subunit S [Candidatus Hodarchaeales archaeon]